MKVTMDKIKEYSKLLSSIDYLPINEKSRIFFDLDTGRTVENGSFVMEVKNQEYGANALAKPGLVLSMEANEKGKTHTEVHLAYAQIEYAPKFDIGSFLDLVGGVSKNNKAKITELDCLLVKNDYILAEFEL